MPGLGFDWLGLAVMVVSLLWLFARVEGLIETCPQLRCRLVRHLSVSHGLPWLLGDPPLRLSTGAGICEAVFTHNAVSIWYQKERLCKSFIYFDDVDVDIPRAPFLKTLLRPQKSSSHLVEDIEVSPFWVHVSKKRGRSHLYTQLFMEQVSQAQRVW